MKVPRLHSYMLVCVSTTVFEKNSMLVSLQERRNAKRQYRLRIEVQVYTKYFVPRVHIETPVRHHLTCTFISSDLVKVRAFTCASSRSPVPASVAWASLVKKQRRSMLLSHVPMMSLFTSKYLGRYFKSLQAQAKR